jgi:hypothetical protein
LSDNFGRSMMYGLSALTTVITVSVVGGLPFIFAMCVLGIVYYNGELKLFFSIPGTHAYGLSICSCEGKVILVEIY